MVHHGMFALYVASLAVAYFATTAKACDANCAGTCIKFGGNTCDSTCKVNYGFISSSYSCAACNSVGCASPCNTAGIGYCDGPTCISNYGYMATLKLCKPCDTNCIGGCVTKLAGKCDQTCNTGYSLSSTFTCILCDPNCAGGCSTRGAGNCDSLCKTGYSVSTSTYKCIACDVNCASNCSTKGVGKCDSSCKTGYTLDTTTYTGTYTCKLPVNGGWSAWTTTACTTVGQLKGTQTRQCNNPTPAYGGAQCTNSSNKPATSETQSVDCACDAHCTSGCTTKGYQLCDGTTCQTGWGFDATHFTCNASVNGGWSVWTTTLACTTVGQLASTQTRGCNNPSPSFGGTQCLDSNNLPATSETQSVACACDAHCTSGCTTKGYQLCDGTTCQTGWGFDATYFTCNASVNGGWTAWTPDVACTTIGQLTGTETRQCTNPTPAYGGTQCLDSNNQQTTSETRSVACACDAHCTSGCTTKGYQLCDGTTCQTGWGFDATHFTCNASVNGGWSQWTAVACTTTGQTSTTQTRQCNNPSPAYGGASCLDSNNQEATSETQSATCPCDSNCVSGCATKGYQQCDGPDCAAGFGYDSTDFACHTCTASYCNGSCNSYGVDKCDGPCEAGYGLDSSTQQTHTCKPCDVNCATTGTNSGCNVEGSGFCDGLCNVGYAINTATKTCGACDANCQSDCKSNGPGTCDSLCKSGYALETTSKTCQPCDPNCASGCSVPYACGSACKAGYVLANVNGGTICRKCDPNCQLVTDSCKNKGAGHCDTTCVGGYVLSSTFTCAACGSNCNPSVGCAASGAGFCDQCSPAPCASCVAGYGLGTTTVAGKFACKPCAQNCNSGCSVQGAGCCDSSCSVGTLTPVSSTCSICS